MELRFSQHHPFDAAASVMSSLESRRRPQQATRPSHACLAYFNCSSMQSSRSSPAPQWLCIPTPKVTSVFMADFHFSVSREAVQFFGGWQPCTTDSAGQYCTRTNLALSGIKQSGLLSEIVYMSRSSKPRHGRSRFIMPHPLYPETLHWRMLEMEHRLTCSPVFRLLVNWAGFHRLVSSINLSLILSSSAGESGGLR